MTNTEKKIEQLVKPIIEQLGYMLYDVIYEKEGKDNYLRIFIDKEGEISINDCENVNNAITDVLDEKDYIKNSYLLEVSSPGIERRLRSNEHLKKHIGEEIQINAFTNIDELKQKQVVGILKDFNDEMLKIEVIINNKSKEVDIKRDNISKISTVYNWEGK